MKKTILKITILTLFGAAIVGTPALSRAAKKTTAPAATTADASGQTKFYGPVSAVNTNAMTLTVNDLTLTVTAKTALTSAKDGKPATLADAVVGEPARGSYTKGKDGKLDVTKMRFGKKAGGKAGGGKAGGKKKTGAGAADSTAPATPPQK